MVYIFLIFLVITLTILGKQYYLIANILIRILPYLFIIELFNLNQNKIIIIVFYFIYKIIYNLYNKNKIPTIDLKFSRNFLINSTKFIDIKILKSLKVNNNQNYIFLFSPHAIYNQGFIYLFGNYKLRNNIKIIPLVHSLFKYTPIISELFSCFGFMDCTRSNIDNLLDQKYSIALSPGGIQEIFITKPDQENIYINNRNSIFKISIIKQVKIVPVLGVGESDWFIPPKFCDKIKMKYFKLANYLLSWGKKYQPWLPRKNKLDLLFGDPIDFLNEKNEIKTVVELKKNYIDQLKSLNLKSNQINEQDRKINIF